MFRTTQAFIDRLESDGLKYKLLGKTHGGDEAVQRRRHHVKAVEPHARPAQKRRAPGLFRRQRQFALAVLEAAGKLFFVGCHKEKF